MPGIKFIQSYFSYKRKNDPFKKSFNALYLINLSEASSIHYTVKFEFPENNIQSELEFHFQIFRLKPKKENDPQAPDLIFSDKIKFSNKKLNQFCELTIPIEFNKSNFGEGKFLLKLEFENNVFAKRELVLDGFISEISEKENPYFKLEKLFVTAFSNNKRKSEGFSHCISNISINISSKCQIDYLPIILNLYIQNRFYKSIPIYFRSSGAGWSEKRFEMYYKKGNFRYEFFFLNRFIGKIDFSIAENLESQNKKYCIPEHFRMSSKKSLFHTSRTYSLGGTFMKGIFVSSEYKFGNGIYFWENLEDAHQFGRKNFGEHAYEIVEEEVPFYCNYNSLTDSDLKLSSEELTRKYKDNGTDILIIPNGVLNESFLPGARSDGYIWLSNPEKMVQIVNK